MPMSGSCSWLCRVAGVLSVGSLLAGSSFAAEPPATKFELDPAHAEKMKASAELFSKSVRNILTSKCVKCHGGAKTESGLDLATREALLKGGEYNEQAIVPGKGKESFLVRTLQHVEEPSMPAEGDKLSEAEIASIIEWIDLGAAYDKPLVDKIEDPLAWTKRTVDPAARQHWAFQPLGNYQPPRPESKQQPIDQFVTAKLLEKQLEMNKPADVRTLVRRAYFDLTGLPPTPEQLKEVAAGPFPESYHQLIDRLLASQHYGERWGRHWLDVARFAESHGFEQDYDRPHAYVYRDFVIEALNRDLPFTTFVKWQLAGDEYEPNNPLALKATGFLGAGVFPTQITANEVERTRYDAIDDMASTTSTAFLGLTVGCARCHDHKFDPIPQADYYRFAATFVTTVRSNQDVNLDPAGFEKAKVAFAKTHEPLVAALRKYEQETLPTQLANFEREHGKEATAAKWLVLDWMEVKSHGGATLTPQPDGSLLASGTNPDFDTYTLVATTKLRDITGIKVEALAHPSFVKGGPGRAANGNIDLTDFRITAQPLDGKTPAVEIKLQNAQATFEQQPHLLATMAIDDNKKSGWALDPQFGKDHAAVFETAENVGLEEVTKLTFTLDFQGNNQHNIGRVRISVSQAPRPLAIEGEIASQQVVEALALAVDQRSPEQQGALLKWYAPRDAQWQKLDRAVQEHLAKTPQPNLEKMMICSEGVTPIRHHTQGADFFNEFYFAHRGDCNEKRGVATPGFLQVLKQAGEGEQRWQLQPPEGAKTSFKRRALAEWLTDTEQGAGELLARVIVNRVWQHHLGRGLVSTPNDFGKQGTPPTHPELLDYLARDFIDHGWQLKRLHQQIMTSATYMQSSQFDAKQSSSDPQNQYYWRFAPRRLEAESIRDSMLAVSGELDTTLYGPGTLEEGMQRRSIYFMVKRSRLIPMMTLFDSPEPLVSIGERPATTIAPQALAFMNNPHVRKWATTLGKKLAEAGKDSTEEAVRQGYLIALARQPDEDERQSSVAFVEAQRKSYADAGKANARELALADFAQVLFSLNEFVFVD